jgi:FMN-dependent dehydrogenase
VTLRANREGFLKFQLRPRRLVDVGTIDMTTDILGTRYDSPIVIAPTGSNKAFHAEGEVSRIRRLGLSVAKEDAIVSFMQTLTDGFMLVNSSKSRHAAVVHFPARSRSVQRADWCRDCRVHTQAETTGEARRHPENSPSLPPCSRCSLSPCPLMLSPAATRLVGPCFMPVAWRPPT